MEEDGDEQNDKAVGGDGDGHPHKDGVEQDTSLEQGNVEVHGLEGGRVHGPLLGVAIVVQVDGRAVVELRLFHRVQSARRDGQDHVLELLTLTDILGVKDLEPGGHVGEVVVLFHLFAGGGRNLVAVRVGVGFLHPVDDSLGPVS